MKSGFAVEQVVLQDVNPPDPVKPSWDAVNQAQQQRDRMINEALGEYNQVIPRARGEAQQAILQAEGFALERVNRAQGDGARFNDLYSAYRQAPQVHPATDVSGNDPEGTSNGGRQSLCGQGCTGDHSAASAGGLGRIDR